MTVRWSIAQVLIVFLVGSIAWGQSSSQFDAKAKAAKAGAQ
ncbi:MAG TPA: hypothetical protein VK593_08045 [Edaphobacter sp.]|nr:hypothetical protein [Edaphobacter sp.]